MSLRELTRRRSQIARLCLRKSCDGLRSPASFVLSALVCSSEASVSLRFVDDDVFQIGSTAMAGVQVERKMHFCALNKLPSSLIVDLDPVAIVIGK